MKALKDLEWVKSELLRIEAALVQAAYLHDIYLKRVHPDNYERAINLMHYLVLRSMDVRALQDHLHAFGLSSLASSESHILGQIQQVLARLGVEDQAPVATFAYQSSLASLKRQTKFLFGKQAHESMPHLMVTFDRSFADEYKIVKKLMESGMNVARINCAHDDAQHWLQMVQHVQRAKQSTGLPCKIYMDLAGPKNRTVLKNKDRLKIKVGHDLLLTDEAHLAADNEKMVGCTIDGIAEQLKVGERVLFDDGLIEAKVTGIEGHAAHLKLVRISRKKPYLKNEKGINFPDSNLKLTALTDYDRSCLPFVLQHADMVGYSFVRNGQDVGELNALIPEAHDIAVILKIEIPEAVLNLPDLIYSGLARQHLGIMIARGDLAVEIGFERMSEIQEEILGSVKLHMCRSFGQHRCSKISTSRGSQPDLKLPTLRTRPYPIV